MAIQDHFHLFEVGGSAASYKAQSESLTDAVVAAKRSLNGTLHVSYLEHNGHPAVHDDMAVHVINASAADITALRALVGRRCSYAPLNHTEGGPTYVVVRVVSVSGVAHIDPYQTYWTCVVNLMTESPR